VKFSHEALPLCPPIEVRLQILISAFGQFTWMYNAIQSSRRRTLRVVSSPRHTLPQRFESQLSPFYDPRYNISTYRQKKIQFA
jgi:hypothetical protein